MTEGKKVICYIRMDYWRSHLTFSDVTIHDFRSKKVRGFQRLKGPNTKKKTNTMKFSLTKMTILPLSNGWSQNKFWKFVGDVGINFKEDKRNIVISVIILITGHMGETGTNFESSLLK